MADFDPKVLRYLTPQERNELDTLLLADKELWHPWEGTQTEATHSPAQILGFGGAGGGGKSDFGCGIATREHRRAIIFREVGTELYALRQRLEEIIGKHGQFNGKDSVFHFTRPRDGAACTIELGSFPDVGDERKYSGRPHDLIVYDEAADMREAQVRYTLGWLRTTDPNQRCRAILTFNPPRTPEGRWVIAFFAPWLDPKHPNPAQPGELRWFATIKGKDIEVPGPRPFVIENGEKCYDFDARHYRPEDIIRPMSRTFIPSRITDNPFLRDTGYMTVLQGLPEPLRSQLLHGDFRAGLEDARNQVIPTKHVELAMARWEDKIVLPPMDSVGADIAYEGTDEHVVITRHGWWFSKPDAVPGYTLGSGKASAHRILMAMRDGAPMHLDLFGAGAKPYGELKELRLQVVGVNVGDQSVGFDATGRLRFSNLRSELWWRMRELLDPSANNGIALPPEPKLLADLCAPTWHMRSGKVYIESSDEIREKTGRSPDYGTAAVLAAIETPKWNDVIDAVGRSKKAQKGYDPWEEMERLQGESDYDPFRT